MFLQAHVTRENGSEHVLRVRNLSPGGIMADSANLFVIDEPVLVEVRGIGKVPGRIAWFVDGRIGVAFNTPVDPTLARKAPQQSPGTGLLVTQAVKPNRRPGLKIS